MRRAKMKRVIDLLLQN